MPPIVEDADPDDEMPMTTRYQDFQITTWRQKDRTWAVSITDSDSDEIQQLSFSQHHSRKDAFLGGQGFIDEHFG